MIIDGRKNAPETPVACDVCIVGGGAAGITLAHELAHAKRTICVVEAGGLAYQRTAQALLASEPLAGYPALHTTRLSALGGSTAVWSGWSRPLDEIDYEHRDGHPHSGWPITAADLQPFYAQAHQMLALGDFDYDPQAWERATGSCRLPLKSEDIETLLFRQSRVKFGSSYRAALAAADHTRVYLNSPVIGLGYSSDARSVTAVRCATLTGRRFELRPKLAILAAGGIENARVLLLAAAGNVRGPGNPHGNVGRYFTEHGYLDAAIYLPANPQQSLSFYQQLSGRSDGTTGRGALRVSASVKRRAGLLNCAMFFRPAYESDPAFENARLKDMLQVWDMVKGQAVPDRMISRLMSGAPSAHLLALAAYKKYFGKSEAVRWRMRTLFECSVDRENCVELGSTRDALGRPQIRIHWRMAESDVQSVIASHQILDRSLQAAGLGHLEMCSESPTELAAMSEPGKHHMGTTRMHDDASQGVVNRDCRVHGVDNLFVAGSSVFTTGGFTNPTLTIVALALRLAAHLKAGTLT